MVRILWEVEVKKGVTAITSIIPDTVQWRCSGCGLEWGSAHDAEACPLRELEEVFLAEYWFAGSGELNDESRKMMSF